MIAKSERWGRPLRALVDDATERCPFCQAIRGNVAMRVTAQFDA